METNEERLTFTVPEVAALLRISRGAAYEAVKTGALPGVLHFGRTIRISKYVIEQWLRHAEGCTTFSTNPSKRNTPVQTVKENQG